MIEPANRSDRSGHWRITASTQAARPNSDAKI